MISKKTCSIYLLLVLNLFAINNISAQRIVLDFNSDWKFSLDDNADAAITNFDDLNWQKLSVPHDWAFEEGVSKKGAQGDGGGYFGGGIGWYRKSFFMPVDWKAKVVTIEFDGVYMNSEVWINGHYLAKRPYGYISFRYDISQYLNSGNNIIAVRVDNSLENSARWYHPCGIYAPVRLIANNKQHIAANGVFIRTTNVEKYVASLAYETVLENKIICNSKAILETSIYTSEGALVSKSSKSFNWNKDTTLIITGEIKVPNPNLWSTESPYLYEVITRLRVKKKIIDEVKTKIGIRTIDWISDTGFWMNGKNIKLLGVCEHYEGGPVGGAWTEPLLRWKLSLLKEMGTNAIRTAHNPAPPMFYDLCDEMGFLVMDEIFDGWKKKAKFDYGMQAFDQWWKKDISEWITRNRNHPSIVIYSLGNETKGDIAKDLVALCHQIDSTRPVTSGHSGSEFMDVFGVNGGSERKGFINNKRPAKPFVATEAPHTWQTRGYYKSQTWYRDGYKENGIAFEIPDLTEKEIFHYEWASKDKWTNRKQHFNSSYDNATVRISARRNWQQMRDTPWFSGHFRWTGFDYYGEAGYVHGGWPFRLFMGGALDVAGFEKDLFYFYKSQWTTEAMVHILPHWTHPIMEKGTIIPVWVYSNCDEVELFLNGRSLGKDKLGKVWNEMQCEWLVPYEEGTLIAKAYKDGKEITSSQQISAGRPSALSLALESKYVNTQKDNIAIVTTAINDSVGILYPYGENQIYYHLEGPCNIRSLENGDPVDTTNNSALNHRKAFMGLTRAFLDLEDNKKDVTLTSGAILGEKRQLTSNYVSIDVQSIAVRGKLIKKPSQIFYTTNGSFPTNKSKVYTNSFKVSLGTTVKAIIVQDEQIILSMEETFADNLGMHWGEETLQIANPWESKMKIIGMKAINAEYLGAVVKSNGNGQKHLDFAGKEGSIIWYQENDGVEREGTITVYYAANDLKSNRPMDVYLNDKKIKTIQFKPTGSWNSKWKTVVWKQKLIAGANNIELRTTGKSGPNIISLKVQ